MSESNQPHGGEDFATKLQGWLEQARQDGNEEEVRLLIDALAANAEMR